MIKRGECVGFYSGASPASGRRIAITAEGDGGPSRDAYDAAGRLVVDGRKVNCHGWRPTTDEEGGDGRPPSRPGRVDCVELNAPVGDDARFHTALSTARPRTKRRALLTTRPALGRVATRKADILPNPSSLLYGAGYRSARNRARGPHSRIKGTGLRRERGVGGARENRRRRRRAGRRRRSRRSSCAMRFTESSGSSLSPSRRRAPRTASRSALLRAQSRKAAFSTRSDFPT